MASASKDAPGTALSGASFEAAARRLRTRGCYRKEVGMFTGIVTDVGEIVEVRRGAEKLQLTVACRYDVATVDVGASVAHAGVCLTVVGATRRGDRPAIAAPRRPDHGQAHAGVGDDAPTSTVATSVTAGDGELHFSAPRRTSTISPTSVTIPVNIPTSFL